MANEQTGLDTTLSVAGVKEMFRSAILSSEPQARFGLIESDNNPFGRLDGAHDFSGYAAGMSLITQWCVQIYIRDRGVVRRVELVTVGSSPLAKAWAGTRNTASLLAGRPKAAAVLAALKSVEFLIDE